MTQLLLVGVGGFVGAVARYLLGGWVQRAADALDAGGTGSATAFPFGTLVVNVVGCFALGALLALGARLPEEARLVLGVGVFGALTTFSTFSVETFDLLRRDAAALALGNIAGSLVAGITAAWLGHLLGRAMVAPA